MSTAPGSPLMRVSAGSHSPSPGASQDHLPQRCLHWNLSAGSASGEPKLRRLPRGAASTEYALPPRARWARSSSQTPEVPPLGSGSHLALGQFFLLKGHRPPFTWLQPHKQVRGGAGLMEPLCRPCCLASWAPGCSPRCPAAGLDSPRHSPASAPPFPRAQSCPALSGCGQWQRLPCDSVSSPAGALPPAAQTLRTARRSYQRLCPRCWCSGCRCKALGGRLPSPCGLASVHLSSLLSSYRDTGFGGLGPVLMTSF